jgi:hypothetical protein
MLNALNTPITIQTANGTYASCGITHGLNNDIVINGNAGSPSSVIFSAGISAGPGSNVTLQNLQANSPAPGSGVAAADGANITLRNIYFGPSDGGIMVFASLGGRIQFVGPATITGNASAFASATDSGSIIVLGSQTFTFQGPVTIPVFVSAANLGQITTGGGPPDIPNPTFTNSGNLTGKQFQATTNGVISSFGTTFPGTIAGTTGTGGIEY